MCYPLYSLFSISPFPPEVVKWSLWGSNIMILAAVLLWVTFIIFGMIAKRYQIVLRKRTGWQFIMIAPSGILIFAIIMFYSSVISGKLKMGAIESIIAYGFFFLSGIFSTLGAIRFKNVVSPSKKGGET